MSLRFCSRFASLRKCGISSRSSQTFYGIRILTNREKQIFAPTRCISHCIALGAMRQSTSFPERNPNFLCLSRFSTYPPHTVVNLPNLSPTMETGGIVTWAKNEGDEVSEGDLLAEIETDKATMSFEASDPGYLAKILKPAGAKDIPVNTPLCIMVEDADSIAAFKDYVVTSEAPPAKVDTPISAPPPSPPSPSSTAAGAPATSPPIPPSPSLSVLPTATPSSASDGVSQRVFVSPLARRLAAEQGIDLTQLAVVKSGTGIHGMFRAADLVGAAAQLTSATTSLPAAPMTGTFTDVAVSNMRAVIAKRLTESKQTIPHYYLTVDIELDEVLNMRTAINQTLAKQHAKSDNSPPKVTLNDVIIKAVASTCLRIPECNSSWQGDFIRQYNSVDVSVAVATEAGLITPIVFAAETKGLLQINQDVRHLVTKAKENKLQPHEFQGGTFTISNLGMFGISSFSAIINPPQACLLTVGNTQSRIVPDETSSTGFRTANVMSMTLCCDHRVVDGAVGAVWLTEFKKALENPMLMLV